MQLALTLGRRGLGNTWPNPAVGAVVVKDGRVIGRGWTQPGGRPHAETEALRRAGEQAKGATLYVTLEPCSHHGRTPPCADAVVAAGIVRVVSALGDPNPKVAGDGYARLRAAGIAVTEGVCADEARRDHAGHIRRILDERPHVLLKLAVSADGKAALAGGRPAAITGEATRARVHMMRAMSDAILVGIGTVLADDPALTCRLPGMLSASPVRVVLDSDLRLPVRSALVASARGGSGVDLLRGGRTDRARACADWSRRDGDPHRKSGRQPRSSCGAAGAGGAWDYAADGGRWTESCGLAVARRSRRRSGPAARIAHDRGGRRGCA